MTIEAPLPQFTEVVDPARRWMPDWYGWLQKFVNSTNSSLTSLGGVIESQVLTAAAVPLTTTTPANVTSISLTAGTWLVWGNVAFNAAIGTTITLLGAAVSTVSATLPTAPASGGIVALTAPFAAGVAGDPENILPAGMRRITVTATTTVYLVGTATFAVSTMAAYGYLGACRVTPT